jgi:hypothetical protein
MRHLVHTVAFARWGTTGVYRVIALSDPEVSAAREALGRIPPP